VALYLHVGRFSPELNAVVLLMLSALVFWRVGYVYPSRTPVLRGLTLALAALWAGMLVGMILAIPAVPPALSVASLFFPVYYVALSVALQMRRRGAALAGPRL
jgi:phosphatidylcholine synthase